MEVTPMETEFPIYRILDDAGQVTDTSKPIC